MGGDTMLYRVHEFAARAGVTVRALHHYDRLGLLEPTARTGSRYRLYSDLDLARLEQIVVLKFLGLPLREIRDLLQEDPAALADALRRQQRILIRRRQQLDSAVTAIAHAERSLRSTKSPDWSQFRCIIKEIEMQHDNEWVRKYYTDEAQAQVDARHGLWSPELQERVSREWAQLFADVEAALDDDPASERAQALASRWRDLLAQFTGGDPEVQRGLNVMYADQSNWPAEQRARFEIRPEIQAFIAAAARAGTARGTGLT